jgi:DNA mismatch repair protein MutS
VLARRPATWSGRSWRRRRQSRLTAMTFRSILNRFEKESEVAEPPDYFVDLNLDQIVAAITAGADEYNLKPFFHEPLKQRDDIEYRHEVMRDFESDVVLRFVKSFAHKMKSMRQHLAWSAQMYYRVQKESLFLDSVEIYCAAVRALLEDMRTWDLTSRGLAEFREYVAEYVGSQSFSALGAETDKLKDDLGSIRYCILIKGSMLTVTKYDSEKDYGTIIQGVFEKFKQGAASQHIFKFGDFPQMNHIEAGVLDRVGRLYPKGFAELDAYYLRNANYLDDRIGAFDREVQFYISYIDFMSPLKNTGLSFCYPEVSQQEKSIDVTDTFDLALAKKLLGEKSSVVRNDFYLRGRERIFIVSGPNQGGKTTFARTFGQLHHLAAIGCPVPGVKARLFLFDTLLTHFEREENIQNMRGKLQDDLFRIHQILERATANSIVIMNEIFNSTTLRDALFLSAKILKNLIELDALCVCVTFIDELAALSDTTVSVVSNVDPDNPAVRTYKLVRRPADGLAYALSIAEKYGLTYAQLQGRLAS